MKRIQLLDYGRFLAALSVVAFHYLFNGIHNGKISSISHMPPVIDFAKYGYLGVEFFFMISGYVIFFSAKNRSASQFAVSRALRLYPAFWAAVIFTSIFAFFWGGDLMKISPSLVLTNLTMVPKIFGQGYVDGVYWTLMYEIKFYALVFFLLFIGAQKHLEKIFLMWPLFIAIALYSGNDSLPYLGGYFCYFSAGTILAMLKEDKNPFYYTSLLLILYLCIHYSTGSTEELTISKGIHYSNTVIGLIVVAFFVFFLVANSRRGSQLHLYKSRLLGGLTYPLYLIHAHFGYMFISQYATEDNKLLVYTVTVFLALITSYLIHVFIENKLHHFWTKLFSNIVGRPIEFFYQKWASMTNSAGFKRFYKWPFFK